MASMSSRTILQLANASGEGIGGGNVTAVPSDSENEASDVAKLGKLLAKNKEKGELSHEAPQRGC